MHITPHHLVRSLAAAVSVGLLVHGTMLNAQLVRPPVTIQKTIQPPPAIAPVPIMGYEVVVGPPVDVAPLSYAEAAAQCPAGKIALGAGVDFTGADDASPGYESKGAAPDGARLGIARVRNANVFVKGTARAIVTCATPPANLRKVLGWGDGSGAPFDMACNARETIAGGGLLVTESLLPAVSQPRGSQTAAQWHVEYGLVTPRLPSKLEAAGVILCASSYAVDGWEISEAPPVTLGQKSRGTLTAQCPAGKVALAGGVVQRSGERMDMMVNRLLYAPNGSSVSAQVHNRNVLPNNYIGVGLVALCARRG